MSLNPTALLKVVAALTPIMGNAELGAAMVQEIQAIFQAMTRAADAEETIAAQLTIINGRLSRIEEKLQGMVLPLSNGEIDLLTLGDYPREIEKAIALQEHHNG